MSTSDVLLRITTALDRSHVAYMLTGSFASAYYGTPRTTQDIDVIVEVTPAQLSAFIGSLPAEQFYSEPGRRPSSLQNRIHVQCN